MDNTKKILLEMQKTTLGFFGAAAQIEKTKEELGELHEAINEAIKGLIIEGDNINMYQLESLESITWEKWKSRITNVEEEIADVYNMLDQLVLIILSTRERIETKQVAKMGRTLSRILGQLPSN